MKTGLIEHQRDHPGQYGDFTSNDYQESMNIVAKAQSMFNQLPSQIRNEFDNDPAQFLDFVQDPQNEDQLVDMGLANPREKIEPAAHKTAPKAGSKEDGAKAPSDKPHGASGTVTT
jgi:phage internal scaffolding protein